MATKTFEKRVMLFKKKKKTSKKERRKEVEGIQGHNSPCASPGPPENCEDFIR